MKREVATSAAWLVGAGITGIIGYLAATAAAGGVHPYWPYLAFAALAAAGAFSYIINRQYHAGRRTDETVIYDSEKTGLLGHDFTSKGTQLWNGKEHVGPHGQGAVSFIGAGKKVINLVRTNNGGKYELGLRRYHYLERSSHLLPENFSISGMRRLRITGEAKASVGVHRLALRWNPPKDGHHIAQKEILVTSDTWVPFDEYFQFDATKECYLRIDDHYENGRIPSALQLRRIVVTEEC